MHKAQAHALDQGYARTERWHVNWAEPYEDKGQGRPISSFSPPLGHERRMRADRGTSTATEETQVWQAVRAQLRSLDSARSSSLAAYEKLLKASSDAKNIDVLYDVTEQAVHDEEKYVDVN